MDAFDRPSGRRKRASWWRFPAVWPVFLAAAAMGQAPPEQPDWSQSPAAGPASVETTIQPPPPEGTVTPPGGNPRPPAPGPDFRETPSPGASPDAPPAASSAAPTGSSPGEDATEPAELGVPQEHNFFLPHFDNDSSTKPFFEREGLRFRAGPVNLRMSLALSSEYDDNLFATNTDPTPDLVQRVSPQFVLGVGDFGERTDDFLRLEYRPEFGYYLENTDQNRVNQYLTAGGQASFSRYTTEVELSYVDANTPSATQTGRQNYQILDFGWDNSYFLTGKTFARLSLSALGQNYEGGEAYTTYTASPLLGYQYSAKTVVYMGPFAGIAYIGGPDSDSSTDGTQTFQGITTGFEYDNLRKLKVNGSLGIQSRQFQGSSESGESNFTTPVFDFSANYRYSADTTLLASLSRSVQISDLLQGLTYTVSSFQLSAGHNLSPHFNIALSLTYQYLEYDENSPDGRIDQYAVVSPSVTYTFLRDQCSLSAYYNRQQRTSSIETSSFLVNIYGIRFIYRF